jgi:hypothetical protein
MDEEEYQEQRVLRSMYILYQMLVMDAPKSLISVHLHLLGRAIAEYRKKTGKDKFDKWE